MSQDMETWAKFSSKLWLNQKFRTFAKEHADAAIVWVIAITYCADQLTDGFVNEFVAHTMLGATEDDMGYLVGAGFLEPVDGGWMIHDYMASQNRTRSDVESLSSKRSEAGRRGADKRWRNGKNGKSMANGWQPDSKPMASGWQKDGNPIADTDTDTDTDTDLNNPCCCSLNESNNARAVYEENNNNNNNNDDSPQPSEGTTIPPDWKPDPEDARYAMLWRLDPRKTGRAFRDYHLRHGTKSHDWHATFRGWVQRNPEARQPPDSS